LHIIEQKSNKLVKEYNTNNPFLLCSYKNILCLEQPLHEDINGFAVFYDDVWVITINKDLSKSAKDFTCAHELGHILLHKEYSNIYLNTKSHINRTDKDKDADIFSALLLIPKITNITVNYNNINDLACNLNVPLNFLKLRLTFDGYTEFSKL